MTKSNSSSPDRVEAAREAWSRILNMDGGRAQGSAAGLWASMYAETLLAAAARPESEPVTVMREALEKIADHAAKLRKGTDDWFELTEIEAKAREALARIGRLK